MTSLSVNINKVATIRNARGGNIPNVVKFAIDSEGFGAQGITVHPRPDERHITFQDVYDLKKVVTTEFNIEGYPSENFIKLVCDVKPQQVTLVPDPPEAITSNQGWDTIKNMDFLSDVIARFHKHGIRTSIFIDTNEENIRNAKRTGTERIELYTEPYATDFPIDNDQAVEAFANAARVAQAVGLEVNAGHDLSLENLAYFAKHVQPLAEVSIGHALISDALYLGLQETIKQYKAALI